FRLTKAVAGAMLVRGRGLVLHISSDAAVVGYPRWGAYGISKAALDHLARIAAAELQGTGVRFLSLDPGEMNTGMHADAVPEADPASLHDPTRVAERILAVIEHAESLADGARIEVMASSPHPSLEVAGA
ncbi:MAG TPA: SDR family oxidoreductase, partial [Vicinamibacteria bacterium]|nr:SDR family oxidoreductase [Vicinamibacteria bacterium]